MEGRAATTYPPGRMFLLVGGCLVLGAGVTLLLAAALGSDGYSTLVSGVSRASGLDFGIANVAVGSAFLALAWARGLRPGVGTLVQVVLVSVTVSWGLDVVATPGSFGGRLALLAAAFPVLALGIACYLGSRLGAGPVEAAALALDPPVPFRWSYSAWQGGGALGGWLLGADAGLGTLAVIVLLGPAVDVTARLLRLTVEQPRAYSPIPDPDPL